MLIVSYYYFYSTKVMLGPSQSVISSMMLIYLIISVSFDPFMVLLLQS